MDDSSPTDQGGAPKKDNSEILKKEAEMERVAEVRRKSLKEAQEQKEKRLKRQSEEREIAREGFFAQEAEAKQSAVEKEQWRKAQHEARFEDEKKRFKARLEAEKQAEELKHKKEEEKKQREKLNKLHRQAVESKRKQRFMDIAREEKETTESAETLEVHTIEAVTEKLTNALRTIEQDAKRQALAAEELAKKRRAMAADKRKRALEDAKMELQNAEISVNQQTRFAEQRASALKQEGKRQKDRLQEVEGRQLHGIDYELERTIKHLRADAQRKEEMLRRSLDQRRSLIDDRHKRAIDDAVKDLERAENEARTAGDRLEAEERVRKARLDEGRVRQRVAAEKRGELIHLEEALQHDLSNLHQELERLIKQAMVEADRKRGRVRTDAAMHTKETEARTRSEKPAADAEHLLRTASMEEKHSTMDIEAIYKRELELIDEEKAQALETIRQEREELIKEAEAHAAEGRKRAVRGTTQRKEQAHERRESEEKWMRGG